MCNSKPLLALHLMIIAMAFCLNGSINAAEPKTVSTFNCIGIYWSPEEGGNDNPCEVSYRRVGDTAWQDALPLWFDDRNGEYRGSIVNLEPETMYQIGLYLSDSQTTKTIQTATWTEDLPVLTTNYLPALTTSKINITQSGSPNGYILYTHYPNSNAVVDVNNNEDCGIYVNAAYIIIRELTVINGIRHGIYLSTTGAHDVVIEGCTITNWGSTVSDGGARDLDSAIYAKNNSGVASNLTRIIIQRNVMASPRYGANSWVEYRPYNDSYHPCGPQAVCFYGFSAGNHVIRYNTIYSSDGREFNDGLGGMPNFSLTAGFPACDTDIYGNTIKDAHDDAIESEGINNNNRIWGNYLDKFYIAIGCASVSQGPLYVWRNICGTSRINATNWGGAMFLKAGGEYINDVYYGGGRTYVLHNTCLHTSGGYGYGVGGGINDGSARYLENTASRNNIFEMKMTNKYAIANYNPPDPYDNDFDCDLYLGVLYNIPEDQELNGIYGDPVYSPVNGSNQYYLQTNTLGHDDGCVIPNINDDYAGGAPDMGAFEIGRPPLEFGVNAYTNSSIANVHVDDFESDYDGWYHVTGIAESRDNQTTKYLNYSYKLTGVSTSGAAYGGHAVISVDGGSAYKASMWLYVESVSAGAPCIRIKQWNAQGAPVAYNYSLGYDTNKLATWQLITLNFTTATNACTMAYTLDKGITGAAAVTAFVDRVKLQTVNAHIDEFETDYDGWSKATAITLSRDDQTTKSLNYSLKLTGVNTNDAAYASHGRIKVSGGRAYRASMWLYVESLSAGTPKIRIKQWNAQGAPVAYNYSVGYDTNNLATWQFLTLDFNTDPNAVEVMYTLDKGITGVAAVTAYMDRAKLQW